MGAYNVKNPTPIMYRHIPPFPWIITICKKLVHKLANGIPSLYKYTLFSILCEDHIFLLQRTGRTNTGPFFALRGHVERQSALPLRVKHYNVHDRDGEHVIVHRESDGVFRGGKGGRYYISVGGEGAVCGNGGVG
jgi:hypothetical protein